MIGIERMLPNPANTGKPLEVIERDTERDNYMSALEAKEYGLIDEIIAHH